MNPIPTIMAALLAWLAMSLPGWALDDAIINHPDREIAASYQAAETEIEGLQARVGANGDTEDRLAAFAQLAQNYPLAAEILARDYVGDKDEAVALFAIQVLQDATVMSNHHVGGMAGLLPRVRHMMEQHEKSRAALRPAVEDKRDGIRMEVATYLASLGDAEALNAIETDGAGLYSDVERANLFTLAGGEIGEKFLARYITGEGDIAAQRTAVGYLGSIPAYQPQIRIQYYLNGKAPTELRVTAADTLAIHDSSFPEYALVAVSGQEVDPAFLAAAVGGYVDVQTEQGDLDPGSAQALSERLGSVVAEREGTISIDTLKAFDGLSQRLDAISGALE